MSKFKIISGGNTVEKDENNKYYKAFWELISSNKSTHERKKDKKYLQDLVYNGVKAVNTLDSVFLLNLSLRMISETNITIMEVIIETMKLLSPRELNEIFPDMVGSCYNMNEPVGENIHDIISEQIENDDILLFFANFMKIVDGIEIINGTED